MDPEVTPGLDFFDTGVALVTDKPVEGVESITTAEAEEICWGETVAQATCRLAPREPGAASPAGPARDPVRPTARKPIMSVDTHAPATAAEQFAMRRQSPVQRIQHLLHSHPALSPLLVLIVACIVFTIINPRFAQPATMSIIIQQTAVIAALAIGQTLIMLTAGIDLSVGAISHLVHAGHGQPGGQQRRTGLPGPAARASPSARCAAC